jgi:hypothetical protein
MICTCAAVACSAWSSECREPRRIGPSAVQIYQRVIKLCMELAFEGIGINSREIEHQPMGFVASDGQNQLDTIRIARTREHTTDGYLREPGVHEVGAELRD